MYYICLPLGYLMKWCWQLVGNYGIAIILFTLATKIVLIPVSVWIHKNSIQMVKIQPEINFLKARLFGNNDAIAEEQSKLFKKNHYHPMLSLIPLAIQVILLIGVVQIIQHPLDYLFSVTPEQMDALKALLPEVNPGDSSLQLQLIRGIQDGSLNASGILGSDVINSINGLGLNFLGFDI